MPMSHPYRNATRLVAVAAIALAGVAATAAPASAQATVVTFNSLTESSPGSGTRFVGNCHLESGFLFTAVGIPCTGAAAANAFVAGSASSPVFGGGSTPSLLLNAAAATTIDIRRQDGATFDFTSILLAPFDGAATSVTFNGFRAGGDVSRSVTLAGSQAGFAMFSFADLFIGVTGVQIVATNEFGESLVKFDDFSAGVPDVGVVPEPSTVLLLGSGLCIMLVVGRRWGTRA
ncbi:MAG: PEP-CTERM sorting domain-containing protein [Gemmatimonadaceae bacterium]|nr:PEP-CTERM sorting domain-containing protein [Gemmatimonadaceae bacterium]